MPKKILFVCLGNICRSPLAEALFNDKITKRGLGSEFIVQSCGTGNYHIGYPPDPRTIVNALKNGISISHLCCQLTTTHLDSFDYILAMDSSNMRNILTIENAPQNSHKILLMRSYDPLGKDQDVPDPYHGNEKDFQEVFDILDRSVTSFIETLVE